MWCDVIAKENDTCKLKEMEKDKLRWKQWFGMGMNFSWTIQHIFGLIELQCIENVVRFVTKAINF